MSRGDRVGLFLDKSLESVVGLYAVMLRGATYVPFDPQAPVSRIAYMARDCGVRVLLSGGEKAGAWEDLAREAPGLEAIVTLRGPLEGPDRLGGTRVVVAPAGSEGAGPVPAPPGIDHDLAYILYTSGSTGRPKGVMLTHRNALAFVGWSAERFSVRPEDRLSNHAPLHFDLSVFDLFAAARAAAAVVLVPQRASVFPVEVRRMIDAQRITIWYSVPSVLSMLVERGGLRRGDLPSLRLVLFAGEVFPSKYLGRLMRALPHARFFNLYGPTETNVCTAYEVPAPPDEDDPPVPIGTAISNVEVVAVTDGGHPAATGEVGELHVRGATVMAGYWGDPERTARARIPDPFGPAGDPVYRTGDLVRRDAEGVYHLLGRRDAQVKSRGYRIELGEIEAALSAHPAVLECAVLAVPDELVTNRIEAVVVARGETSPVDLAAHCAARLPRYMIPERFDLRDSLPRTSTGKIDRRTLAEERTRARNPA